MLAIQPRQPLQTVSVIAISKQKKDHISLTRALNPSIIFNGVLAFIAAVIKGFGVMTTLLDDH
jgi:hypothetical protein